MEQPIVGFHFFVEIQGGVGLARPGVLVLIAPKF